MAIASINSVNESSIASFNGVAKADIGSIDGQSFPVDSVSLDPESLYFNIIGEIVGGGDNFVVVTSSGNWTATITDDVYDIIDTFTNSGGNGDFLYVYANTNSTVQDCHSATIRVTKGTAFADLTIYQDGTVLTCS